MQLKHYFWTMFELTSKKYKLYKISNQIYDCHKIYLEQSYNCELFIFQL